MAGVKLYGIADPARVAERTPTFAFTVAGASPRDIAAELGREGIFVWDGNYYALGAMLALGLEEHGGAVRAGFLHYTTLDEVDRFCDLVAVRRAGVANPAPRYNRRAACGCGGIGRRARFRSVCPKGRGGSSPLIRMNPPGRASSGGVVRRRG